MSQMSHLLFILFFIVIRAEEGEDDYEEMINKKVSQEYCNYVINNLTSILDEAYVYSDFVKAPKQPVGYDNYIPKVDLIKELNKIEKNNRTFYEFYRDIQNVLDKTRDGHLLFHADLLYDYYFCIPFKYRIEENNTEKGNNDPFLTIESIGFCKEGYSNETLNKIKELEGKKIISINNLSPYDYLEEMGKKFDVVHSPQARYISIVAQLHLLYADYFPFKKEELNIFLKFEGNESLEIEYKFQKLKFEEEDYLDYFITEKKKMRKKLTPIKDLNQLELNYKIKKGLISLKDKNDDNWDYFSSYGEIKCKVDNVNKYNVLYQYSFYPEDEYFAEYELMMEQCFEEFYSNDYKIIIIEDRNGGGYSDLCIPFSQYLSAKIPTNQYNSVKRSKTNKEILADYSQFLNPDTCMPYTDKDNMIEGEEDKYSEEVTHKKSKIFDYFDVYYKKYTDNFRKDLLSKGNNKKPTDIIIFTDGYSFSCTSEVITQLQSQGAAIIVGYNSKPDLSKKDFDASQSYSVAFEYKDSEYINNLNDLGYSAYITFIEAFDHNDKNIPRTPFEFLVNPVDEVAKIYKTYDDSIYDRFIQEADSIFKKYNDLENGECNPNNKYLYYETSDCDSKLNIDKAHGGYVCGTDGKWDKNKCIASYCDEGYILNDERNKCIKNLCDEINIVEKVIKNIDKSEEFIIEPKTAYYFDIQDPNNTYYFLSSKDYNVFYYVESYNNTYNKTYINNQTLLKEGDYIYVNSYLNVSEKSKLYIINSDEKDIFDYFKNENSKYILSTWKIALIMIVFLL